MKKCPICKKKFPDSEEFCPVHGVKLDEYKSSAAKAWISAGVGILSWFVLIKFASESSVLILIALPLSIFAVIFPRGSEAAFPKWCAYIAGYLMIVLFAVVFIYAFLYTFI